jgi:hypothetical protein
MHENNCRLYTPKSQLNLSLKLKIMETIKRLFTVSDLFMIEHSKISRVHFNDNLADFTAFDSDLDAAFYTAWGTAIAASESQPTDEIVRDQLTQLTAAVDTAMANCRKKFQDSKYFIDRAFPNNAGVQNEFGYNNYDTQRRSARELIDFMQFFHLAAVKYAVQLNAVNYDAANIAGIATLRTALNNAREAQKVFEDGRPLATQTRLQTHNDLWVITVQVSTAAKAIYSNDAARFNMFLLPPSDETTTTLSITGQMYDTSTLTPIEGGLVTIIALNISVSTDNNGRFNFALIPDGTYDLKGSAINYTSSTFPGVVVNGDSPTPTEINIGLSTMTPPPPPMP